MNIARIKKWHWLVAGLLLAFALDWFIQRPDHRSRELNQFMASQASERLRAYPYQFRVLHVEGTTAVLSTPRNVDVPARRALGALFPDLDVKDANNPAFIAAQQELAAVQTEARTIVQSQPGITAVRWELDQAWLAAHGIDMPAK
jgi:hypothetical protein